MMRRAVPEDAEAIGRLLFQVHKIHSDSRPDIYKAGERKFDDGEIVQIIHDDSQPIFVYEDEDGTIIGHAFCIIKVTKETKQLQPRKTMFIDDLCVDENKRGKHVGTQLYNYVLQEAKKSDCDSVTLNVWSFNTDAIYFYEKMGMSQMRIMMEKKLD